MAVIRRGRTNANPLPDGTIPVQVDTGPGIAVPVGGGVITALGVELNGAHFINTAGTPTIVSVTDGAGALLANVEIPPGAEAPYLWNGRPAIGVSWAASQIGVKGQIW